MRTEHFVEFLRVAAVVRHGRGRVLELMARQDADHAVGRRDHAFLAEEFRPGHTRSAGRLAAETAGADLGFRVEDLLVGDLPHHAVAPLQSAEALFEVHRPVDLDGAGNRVGTAAFVVHLLEERVDLRAVRISAVPADLFFVKHAEQRIGPGGVDDGQTRDPVDQAQLVKLVERLAEGAGVSEVSARDHDPVRDVPAQGLQNAEHDRFLPLKPEGVHAVHEVNAQFLRDFFHAGHGIVEIAVDLERLRAVIERLGEFPVGDFPVADEDHGLHRVQARAVQRE